MPRDAKTWTADQLRFIAWLALPKAERRPKTQRALAQVLGCDEATLSDWKRLPGFIDEVNDLARELVKHDVAEVLGVIRRRARAGDLPFVNMVLAMAGMSADVADAGRGPSTSDVRLLLAERLARRAGDGDAEPGARGDNGT